MSKELTEQWRNRKLGGRWYYIKILGKIEIARLSKYNQFYHLPITNGYAANKDVSEVLGPVPDYMDCKGLMYDSIALNKTRKRIDELVSKTDKLENRLKEAEEVIRLYFKNTQNAAYKSLGMNDGYYKKAFIHAIAKEYIEKYGVENE